MQETVVSVQIVPGMRFLVFDFGVYLSGMLSVGTISVSAMLSVGSRGAEHQERRAQGGQALLQDRRTRLRGAYLPPYFPSYLLPYFPSYLRLYFPSWLRPYFPTDLLLLPSRPSYLYAMLS
eukprot:3227486-Rhodomonas_salina.2